MVWTLEGDELGATDFPSELRVRRTLGKFERERFT